MTMSPSIRVCIVLRKAVGLSETFLQAHLDRISEVVGELHIGKLLPLWDSGPILSDRLLSRLGRKLSRIWHGRDWSWEVNASYIEAFRQMRPDVVLAEYGHSGVAVREACQLCNIPLVVHFHGFDASRLRVLEAFAEPYKEMFADAAAVISVSSAMTAKLKSLGCEEEKLVYSPYGIDVEKFQGAEPGNAAPVFCAVGRFVPKKAPHITLLAFSRVLNDCPNATLRMIGDGPLLSVCKDLAKGLGIEASVCFLGARDHKDVLTEMRAARAFVQHSVQAEDGDSEGTPVAILEAGAMGLPVIATRHAGIPDVVQEGRTGLLVDERDVTGMANAMAAIAVDPELATRLGAKAALHVRQYYRIDQSIDRLSQILSAAARREPMNGVKAQLTQSLPIPTLGTVVPEGRKE